MQVVTAEAIMRYMTLEDSHYRISYSSSQLECGLRILSKGAGTIPGGL